MSEKAYFNSSVDKKDYAVIRDEAYKLRITIKQHISNIITLHVSKSRKEVENLTQRVVDKS
jgi:hypothetical protein